MMINDRCLTQLGAAISAETPPISDKDVLSYKGFDGKVNAHRSSMLDIPLQIKYSQLSKH